MAPVGAEGGADVAAGMGDELAPGGGGGAAGAAGAKKGSYVPPALRNAGAAGAAGERMGGSKYGERDDFATLRVTNVSSTHAFRPRAVCLWTAETLTLFLARSPRWQKKASSAICSNASDALRVCSWLRTGRLVSQKALLSSASWTGKTPSRHVTRWMATVSSI